MSEAELRGGELCADGSGAMFDRIAGRYDTLNRILSLGIDRRWRRRTVQALEPAPQSHILDVATGTGDLAFAILAATEATVVGLDPSPGMLEVARAKAETRGVADRLSLVTGVAEELPWPGESFDGACMAFGIRNAADRPRALAEMCRVVRPGGRIAILELSEPRRGPLGPLARFHVRHLVPWIGGLLSGSREYRYLQRSIAAFPAPEEFAAMMHEAGLEAVVASPLTFGACHLYLGTRRAAP